MTITEIRISLRDEDKLRAFVVITLDGEFVVRGIKIIQGGKGLFVAMPSRRKPEGGYQDICHPIDPRTRQWMEQQILDAYHQELERQGPGQSDREKGDRSHGNGVATLPPRRPPGSGSSGSPARRAYPPPRRDDRSPGDYPPGASY